MDIAYDGEIVLREKYGSSTKERMYIKPPNQTHIFLLESKKYSNMAGWFQKIFLPQGYPDSVSKDYLAYQIWDTAQAFCSTITGTLATQEVLRGVGVGDTNATPLAATITWVIKDGCGHLGRILFAFTHGTQLDAFSKKWRLYADVLNDAAMCIEIALPLFRNFTTPVLCISTVMKAIVGVAGGATRTAMTQHHAVRGNLADVSAKDSAQETAVNLVASFTALFIITIFGNSLFIFTVMIILHVVFNYLAVRAVCLRTLNEPRYLQLIIEYLRQETIGLPYEINQTEPIIFYQLGPNLLDLKLCGFMIKTGGSLQRIVHHDLKASQLKSISNVYYDSNYIIYQEINMRRMNIFLKEDASVDDVLCAYFHAVLLSIIICAINDVPLGIYNVSENPRPFTQVCHTIQSADWSREPVTDRSGFQHDLLYDASLDLLKYVNKIVQSEWERVRAGMERTGWDLSKHLIIVDEWRVETNTLDPELIEENLYSSDDNDSRQPILRSQSNQPTSSRTNLTRSRVGFSTTLMKDISSSAIQLKEADNTDSKLASPSIKISTSSTVKRTDKSVENVTDSKSINDISGIKSDTNAESSVTRSNLQISTPKTDLMRSKSDLESLRSKDPNNSTTVDSENKEGTTDPNAVPLVDLAETPDAGATLEDKSSFAYPLSRIPYKDIDAVENYTIEPEVPSGENTEQEQDKTEKR